MLIYISLPQNERSNIQIKSIMSHWGCREDFLHKNNAIKYSRHTVNELFQVSVMCTYTTQMLRAKSTVQNVKCSQEVMAFNQCKSKFKHKAPNTYTNWHLIWPTCVCSKCLSLKVVEDSLKVDIITAPSWSHFILLKLCAFRRTNAIPSDVTSQHL